MENARRRRSPTPQERRIDADRSRRVLLDAALEEFADKGFAGARVREISARAGVSKDLINYHFGGKEGLYAEVQRAWLRREDTFSDPQLPLAENLTRYLHDAIGDPRPMRLLAWRGLTGDNEQPPDLTDTEDLSGMRRRQDRGELAAELDPATVRLVLLGAIAAPIVLPHMARKIFGIDPRTPEFETRYGKGLRHLLNHLAPPSPGQSTNKPTTNDE
ncbi:TetR/AcrR family transcriptional regulator [Actinoallomurus acanthiterrae]